MVDPLIRGHARRDPEERVLEVETAVTAQRETGAGLVDCDLSSHGRLVASGAP